MSVAKTILEQIRTLDPMAMPAWGAKNLVDMGDGLKFQSSGMTRWKGHVHVRYNQGSDAYDIDFFRIRGGNIITDRKETYVYATELVRTIDAQVG